MEGDMPRAVRLCQLGTAYQLRSEHSGSVSDIDEAISCIALAISIVPNATDQMAAFLNGLGVAYGIRQQFLEGIEDIERGLYCQEEAARICPAKDIYLKAHIASNLGGFYRLKFSYSNNLEDLDLMIHHNDQAVLILPDDYPDKQFHLNNLAIAYRIRFDTSQDLADLDQAISILLRAISLSPKCHSYTHRWISNLGDTYYMLYRHSEDNVENLNQALKYQLEGLRLCPNEHADKAERLLGLASSAVNYYYLTGIDSFLQKILTSIDGAAHSPVVPLRTRFRCAQTLVEIVKNAPKQQLVKCWETVMEILPSIVWLGHPISRRYRIIADIGELISNAVSAVIANNQYDTALEWVEAGHSMIWRQITQLRTPLDELRVVDPELAAKLEHISLALERASGAISPLTRSYTDAHCIVSVETTTQHHKLAMEWDRLVLEARSKPSLKNFLRPHDTNILLKSAHSSDIVVICVGTKSSGALVVRKNSTKVEHLPLPEFSYEKATSAYKQLKHVLHDTCARDSAQRKVTKGRAQRWGDLGSVLALLWRDLVKPIINYLGYQLSASNNLPRLTWCTTGPLSFLPLHAAGIYPSNEKVFNYVVSSYTPTLSALIQDSLITSESPSILVIGQSGTPGQAPLPGVREELERVGQIFREQQIVRLEDKDATIDAVLGGMESHSWIHLACHASQNSTAPGTSSFHLYDGPLSISTIMNKSVKRAEFAFLSACQTASGDEDLPDEAVHLAAGMLMAGYRAVIATMWSIRDKDAPMVAENVYAHMMRDGKADSQKAAQALHLALKALREKVGEDMFESWVPFVHIGV